MVDKAKCEVVSLWNLSNYREAELLKTGDVHKFIVIYLIPIDP